MTQPHIFYTPEHKFNRLFFTGILLLMLMFGVALIFIIRFQPEANRPWRVAITNWPGFDYLYLAQQKGFFKEYDLNIRLVSVNSIIDMRTAFERGVIDGYTSAVMDVVESMQETRTPSRIVLITDYSSGGDQILADPSITTLAELKGKRLGIEITSSISRYILGRALENSGITIADIDLLPASQTVMADQTRRGNLDAIVTYEPFASGIISSRPMNNLFDSSRIPEEILDVMVVSPKVMENDPDFSKRLQMAWQNAIDYANAHPEETRALFAERYGITPDAYAAMAEDAKIFDRAAMQRFTNGNGLQGAIKRIQDVLNRPALDAAEVSQTINVWYQQESR